MNSETPQKSTTEDTVNEISSALNNGARMILEQPFSSTYIPNKDALHAWRHRADTLPASPSRDEIAGIISEELHTIPEMREPICCGSPMSGGVVICGCQGATVGDQTAYDLADAILSLSPASPAPVWRDQVETAAYNARQGYSLRTDARSIGVLEGIKLMEDAIMALSPAPEPERTVNAVKRYLERMDDELLNRDGTAELSHEEAKQALRDVYLLSCGKNPEFHPRRAAPGSQPTEQTIEVEPNAHKWNAEAAEEFYGAEQPPQADVRGESLLDQMTHDHRPLSLFRECDEDGGNWVVVDNSNDTVVASGSGAYEAMQAAFPRRCKGGDIDPFNGECLWCGAPMGGVCQDRALAGEEE